MIQRKQTIFLLLAIVFAVVCLCMPIGSIEPKGMGLQSMIWNFGLVVPNQGMNFSHWLLFALLVITIPMEIFAIFQYRNRRVQANICLWSMLFCFVWYIYYGFVAFSYTQPGGTYHVQFAVCLPLLSFVSLILARQGIIKDEKLVKSADRIR